MQYKVVQVEPGSVFPPRLSKKRAIYDLDATGYKAIIECILSAMPADTTHKLTARYEMTDNHFSVNLGIYRSEQLLLGFRFYLTPTSTSERAMISCKVTDHDSRFLLEEAKKCHAGIDETPLFNNANGHGYEVI